MPEPAVRGNGALPRILCVDDEPEILASLRGLLKASGYSVSIADCAAAGLRLLEGESFDLVIADHGMPQSDGTRFLRRVNEKWPQTMRILMDGPVNPGANDPAVDESVFHGAITKPWIDNDLVLQIRQLLERRAREHEERQRAQLALTRSEELKALNASVAQGASVGQDELAQANKRLKSNFIVTLKVLASLIETRRKHMVGHARRVADLARKVAIRLKLEPALVQEVVVAGLLHDIGKLAFPDALLDRPVANMTPIQLDTYRKHPARAEQLLMPLQDLRGAAASIAAQMERFDGAGFPNQLKGRAILVGARILAVCSDYDNLQIGMLVERWLTPQQALAVIERSAGKRYDPWVVEAFSAVASGKSNVSATADDQPDASQASHSDELDDLLVAVNDLDIGSILSRDLVSPGGIMMLPAGHAINDRLIKKMVDFERSGGVELSVYVRKPTDPEE